MFSPPHRFIWDSYLFFFFFFFFFFQEILDDCDLTIDRCREMFIQQVPQNPAEDSLCR